MQPDPTPTATLQTEEKKRRPWLWPLIILGVVAIALVVVLVLLLGSGGTPAPTGTTSAPSQTATTPSSAPSTPTPSDTQTSADGPVDMATLAPQLLNKTQSQVEDLLTDAGLQLEVGTNPDPAKDAQSVGRSYSVNPETGAVPAGYHIEVFFYGPQPTPGDPAAPTAVDPAPYTAGAQITITWDYSGCPADYPIDHFTFTVTGGSMSNTTVSGNKNSAKVTLSSTPGDTTSISYTATCGSLTSKGSPALTVQSDAGDGGGDGNG